MSNDDDSIDISGQVDALQLELRKAKANIFNREITQQELYYLLGRYPYLELCDADYPYVDKAKGLEIITAKTGWKIYNYGSVIASGCHELMALLLSEEHHKREKRLSKEDDEGSGSGTIIRQYSETAMEMMALAKSLGWRMAEVVAGYYSMQRMAWVAGEAMGYPLKGFHPTQEDYVVLHWSSQLRKGQLYPPQQPIPGFGPKP